MCVRLQLRVRFRLTVVLRPSFVISLIEGFLFLNKKLLLTQIRNRAQSLAVEFIDSTTHFRGIGRQEPKKMWHEYSRSRMVGANLFPLVVKRNADGGPKACDGDSPGFLFFPHHTCKNLNSCLCRHVRPPT